jgi:C1A family cysteine protease
LPRHDGGASAIVDAITGREKFMAKKSRKSHSRKARSVNVLAKLAIRRVSSHGGYGWIRDLPDARDYVYAAPLMRFPIGLPASVDLRSACPPIYDQGQLGSCTGNGIAGAIEFDQKKQGTKEFTPSRLFIYYNERVMEGTVPQDAGAQVRDGIKSVATLGAPPETDWSYDIAKFYESFEGQQIAQTGIMTMPASGEKVVGGHCVVAVGYDNSTRMFIIRNSWGTSWGLNGYFMMPYEYMLGRLSSDFWTMRSVAG